MSDNPQSPTTVERLRAVSSGGGSMPNSKIKDLCSDAAAEIEQLRFLLRAILAADERGQGQPFADAMDAAAREVS
jgi:hypothetical protein